MSGVVAEEPVTAPASDVAPLELPTFDIQEPRSVDEALTLLAQGDSAVRPIAGGTALMLLMKYGFFRPEVLVSVRRLGSELGGVSRDGDGNLRIGAATTLRQLERSRDVAECAPVVVDALHHLANVRVRNVATLGGHLAHGDPHMDLPPVLMALDARVRLASSRGVRWLPVADLYEGHYETALGDDELLTEVIIPAQRQDAVAGYLRFTALSADDWPTLGVAVSGLRDGGRLSAVRVAVSAVGDRVTRVAATEALLEGERASEPLFERAGETTAETLLGDERRSYLGHLVRVQVRRALFAAFGAAGSPKAQR